ncbi:MAG: hypothetical protein Q8Q35_03445 [Nanoarchaeota archaeon]|nr:hypothetical protein [Nanoarchaeota archaeon]
MAKKKSKIAKFLGTSARFAWFATTKISKLIFIDSFKTLAEAYNHARHPEEKLMLDRKLEADKKADLNQDKIKRLERLMHSVYNDPTYSKSDKGQDDLKQLRRDVQ